MNLTGIIAISGKSGLYKVVAQGKNNIIVQALGDTKRFPAYASDRISALDDISIYTYDEDQPLKTIYRAIYEKENGGAAISHKEDIAKLRSYLEEVLPNYDQERVYPSDIKKLFQWYNLIHAAGELKLSEEETKVEETQPEGEVVEKEKVVKKEKAEKKAPAKPAAAKTAKTAAPKVAASKKVAPPKTGSSRGK